MRRGLLLALLITALLIPSLATAGGNDFQLHRLSDCRDGTIPGETCIANPDIEAFKSFSKSMGLVFAPSFLSPAESLGQAGFALGFETKFAVAAAGPQWRALNQVEEGDEDPPLFTLLQVHGLATGSEFPDRVEPDGVAAGRAGSLAVPQATVRDYASHRGSATGAAERGMTTVAG